MIEIITINIASFSLYGVLSLYQWVSATLGQFSTDRVVNDRFFSFPIIFISESSFYLTVSID